MSPRLGSAVTTFWHAAAQVRDPLTLSGTSPARKYQPPVDHQDGWTTAPANSVGLDLELLSALTEVLGNSPQANVHALLVVRGGRLVLEQYFSGEDERWGTPLGRVDFDAEVKHDIRAVTASIVGLLVGIALDRAWIDGVDEPVGGYFPEYADVIKADKANIRLSHLLTMSAGLAWDEARPYSDPANSELGMNAAPDPYRFVFEQPMVAPPGRCYAYSSGASGLLAAVLKKTTGRQLDTLVRTALFEPLDIKDVEWLRYVNGDPVAGWGLRLRPRDLAKIGQLLLSGGVWNGQQVVPASWPLQSISPQISGEGAFFYGYHWWLGRSLIHGKEVRWAAGLGWGGQRLFIAPEFDLVVVVTAGLYGNALQRVLPIDILNHCILAATAR
jgi:CubicO group peptidase (beta-lactamase class C family)